MAGAVFGRIAGCEAATFARRNLETGDRS